jgi:hypothetical protein
MIPISGGSTAGTVSGRATFRRIRRLRRIAFALAACCSLLGVPAAHADPASLADRLAERWVGLQRDNGTFLDSIRPETHDWGRYGESGVGYGLMLAGVRTGRPEWVEAGARAQVYAAARAPDRLSVFESMLIASGYNLLRTRAPATPTFAAQRTVWEDYLRTITPVYNARMDAAHLPSNKYLVEAVAYFELARSGLSSPIPGAVLNRPGEARRRGLDVINRLVPRRVRTHRGRAGGHRVAALSDRYKEPLAYHSLTLGLLARAIHVADGSASRRARRALRIGARTVWAFQAPDGDLSYFGRSQGQSWALALAGYAAGGHCDRAARAVAERALRRLEARHPIGETGMAIVPSANGPATIPAIDDYASQVVYNGLTLTALGWAADAERKRCRAGDLLADRGHGGAVLPFESARFATIRRGRVWMAVKRRSQDGDGRSAFGIRALKRRAPGGRWIDLVPAAPAAAGRPRGTFGPALRLRGGALAKPRGEEIAIRGDRIVVRGGWFHRGRWVRRGVTFRFTPTARGARVAATTRKGDRLVYSALTEGEPARGPRGVAVAVASTRASRPADVRIRGPYASSASLDVWRADITARASGSRLSFAIRAR